MRIWHAQLIPKLCRPHLLAMWREGWAVYSIITKNKMGYRNHPAVIEFRGCPNLLVLRLQAVRQEMLKRGYHPKEAPVLDSSLLEQEALHYREWQTLDEQIAWIKTKGCQCQVQ
jgi:hypothetical protein